MTVAEEKLTPSEYEYLNDITARLYADIINQDNGENAMKTFLESLKKVIPFEKGEIYFCDYQKDSITYEDFIFCGWTKEELETYHNEEVYKIDEVLPIVSNTNPVIFRSSDVFIKSEREKTPYYKDVVDPIGMNYSVEGNIYFEDGKLSAISIHRSEKNPDFTAKALEAIRFVRPHLINVSKMYKSMKEKGRIFDYGQLPSGGLSINDVNYCAFDKDCNPIVMNIDALLELSKIGREELIKRIQNAVIASVPNVKMKRQCSRELHVGDRIFLMDIKQNDDFYSVLIYNFESTIDKLLDEVKLKYSLSPREYEVLCCIIDGFDTSEIAEKLCISSTTAKKHLINLYKKMGIKGKRQVLSVLFNNPHSRNWETE